MSASTASTNKRNTKTAKKPRRPPFLTLPRAGVTTTAPATLSMPPPLLRDDSTSQPTPNTAVANGNTTTDVMRGLIGNVDYRLRLVLILPVTSTPAGAIQGMIDLNNMPAYTGWAQAAQLFDEFRVLGGKVHFYPYNRYSKVSTFSKALAVAFDNDAVTSGTISDSIVWQYGTAKLHNIDDPFVYMFERPHITSSAYWADVALPTAGSFGGVLYSADSVTLSTDYGQFFVELEVQFRSSR